MPYPKPNFPENTWDGLSNNIDRVDVHANVNPNSQDWERIAAELISVQENSNALTSQAVTEDITLLASDTSSLLLVDCTAASVTITLPPAVDSTGRRFVVKRTDASGNNITIDGNGVETIDGATTQAVVSQYDVTTVFCDGVEWFIV